VGDPAVIYDASAHEPLTETPWDAADARGSIAAIIADAEGALRDGGWPNHPLDEDPDEPLPAPTTTLYLGAAGMIWALHTLGSTLDLASLAGGALEQYRARPDFGENVPSLWMGESGLLLVSKLVGASFDQEQLRARIRDNERNETWELMWGSPGTILAARAVRLDAEWRESCDVLIEQWDLESGLWTQHLYGSVERYLGPAHGYAGNVHVLRHALPDAELRTRVRQTLERLALVEDGLANWPPTEGSEPTRLQWCHGAPGIVATLGDLMPIELMRAGAELTWQAGPLVKGPGLCHGTAGNGYALLRTHEVTGDDVWLDRARRFAMHALEQVERARAEYGRGRYTLFTGDIGAALFARSCIDDDPRFPTIDVW
jgi:Lanthionine synthetase C-like protein